MGWMFLVTAANSPRVHSRVLQILDHHMVSLESFASVKVGDEIQISVVVDAEEVKIMRIQAIFGKLQDLRRIETFPVPEGAGEQNIGGP